MAQNKSCKLSQLPAKSCKKLQVAGPQSEKTMGRQNHSMAAERGIPQKAAN
jgi:hypothetical protein